MIPYTAHDMLRAMRTNFQLDEPIEKERSRSIFRFIAAIQGAFSR
jgi:hypothetical protein